MQIQEGFNMQDFLNVSGTVYFKAENMKISRYSGFDDWRITDLTNALKTGKTCREYTLKSERGEHGNCDVTNFIYEFENLLDRLWMLCESFPFEHKYDPVKITGIEIYRTDIKSIRVFSPFNLGNVKPLKAMPKKWTLRHVYAALINRQFKELRCAGVYSDDYAWDNAVNYHIGPIKAPLAFVKRIIEQPSGWWCNYWDDKVHVCCHSFDNNDFVPVIN